MATGMMHALFGLIRKTKNRSKKRAGRISLSTISGISYICKVNLQVYLLFMENTQNSQQLASDLRTVITRLIKKLRNKSTTSEKLSLTERSTISLLDRHRELLPSELAAMEKITTQSMSQILNHLLELGYIVRRVSPTDKRKVIISLSKAGQHILY